VLRKPEPCHTTFRLIGSRSRLRTVRSPLGNLHLKPFVDRELSTAKCPRFSKGSWTTSQPALPRRVGRGATTVPVLTKVKQAIRDAYHMPRIWIPNTKPPAYQPAAYRLRYLLSRVGVNYAPLERREPLTSHRTVGLPTPFSLKELELVVVGCYAAIAAIKNSLGPPPPSFCSS